MKTLILAVLLFALPAHTQVVSLFVTNYSLTIRGQNNLGKWRPSWQDSAVDSLVITNGTLTLTHTVSFAGIPSYGTAGGGPNRLEDRYVYRQTGSVSFWPIGGEEITVFVAKPHLIAQTNIVLEADMMPLIFVPAFVGELTFGDAYSRTITTGSPLVMGGRNLAGTPWLFSLPCSGDGADFAFLLRFERGERKKVVIAPHNEIDWFWFDLNETGGHAL